jgi:hypothetical protein
VSAYRSAERAIPPQVVLCPGCGARILIEREQEFRCERCGLREAALREDSDLRSPVEPVHVEDSGYLELRGAARAFGRDVDCSQLQLKCDGVPCTVGLYINSGTACGVEYSIATSGLPPITLRREQDSDQQAKALAIAREVQTGDEEFDRAVYIESDAADGDVLTVLSAPGVRQAVRLLLARVDEVKLGPDGVTTDDRDRPECFNAERVRTIVATLRVIAGAPRLTVAGPAIETSEARKLANLVWFFLPTGILSLIVGCLSYPAVSYSGLVFAGGGFGLIAWILIQPMLKRATRGRSTSHRELMVLGVISFPGLIVLGVGLAVLLNGALDRSPEWVEEGVVKSSEYDGEDDDSSVTIKTDARSADMKIGESANEVRVGQPAKLWLRRGVFGSPWKTKPSVVTTEKRQRYEK